jgi:hypothetical protein
MKHSMHTRYVATAAALSLATVLAAGCGSKDEQEASAKAAKAELKTPEQRAAAARAQQAREQDERLADAVATSKTGAPLDLKYDISTKPAVGQPFEVELTFAPRASADALEVQVSAVEGLTLVGSGGVRFDNVQQGERYTTKVLAQSAAAGIYYIGVSAKMTTKVQTEVRNFSVPVVVGTAVAAEKPAPEKDASGKPIESMPAVESGTKK